MKPQWRLFCLLCVIILFVASGDGNQGSPQCSPGPSSLKYLSSVTCARDHVTKSLRGQAACTPRDKVVPVPWPRHIQADQVTPSHVTVKRCSGGCHTLSLDCVSTNTVKRKVEVLLARCPLGGGKCEKECAHVEVEDEVECQCGCRKKAEECREDQTFQKETCSCQCTDIVSLTSCQESGRSWDSSSCSCLCPHSITCSPGQELDTDTCTCLSVSSDVITKLGDVITPEEGHVTPVIEAWEDFLPVHWEYLVILALASLNLLLLSIIVILYRRHKSLRRSHRNQPSHLSSSLAENFYAPHPVNNEKKGGGGEGAVELNQPKLYTSDSDISSEQQSNGWSEKESGVGTVSSGGTDSSYCRDSLQSQMLDVPPYPASPRSSCSPSSSCLASPCPSLPLHYPPPVHPHYRPLHTGQYSGIHQYSTLPHSQYPYSPPSHPCCSGMSSINSMTPLLTSNPQHEETHSMQGRETPL